MRKIIEITIDPKGNSQVETKGFTGNACQLASKFIEQALGKRTDEKLTAEFHQQIGQQQSNHNNNI